MRSESEMARIFSEILWANRLSDTELDYYDKLANLSEKFKHIH